jgi:hypothetical protein
VAAHLDRPIGGDPRDLGRGHGLAITLPVFETGSDPTRIPFAAFFAPVAAVMLTALAGMITNVFRRGPGGG